MNQKIQMTVGIDLAKPCGARMVLTCVKKREGHNFDILWSKSLYYPPVPEYCLNVEGEKIISDFQPVSAI